MRGRCDLYLSCFFFQAEDGIRDLVRSRGLGDVYKRQVQYPTFGIREILARVLAMYIREPILSLHLFGELLSLIHI